MTEKSQSKSAITRTRRKQNLNITKIFYIACYAIVPVFFAIAYIFMTKAHEDLTQTYFDYGKTTPELLHQIYHYIPRIGEFYQHVVMQFMTAQVSFGPDLFFRLLIAAMSVGLIYLLTVFVLCRRPKLQLKDVIIYLGLFVVLLAFELAMTFLYEFAYAHNYVIAALILVGFLLPYRLASRSSCPLAYIGMLILGFLLGISTEITPIAILIIMVGLAAYLKHSQRLSWKEFWRRYHLQITGVIGILLGLVFFYLGAGLSTRTNGAYGEICDYIPLSNLLSNPVGTIEKLLEHVWYNTRYLTFGLIFVLFILLHEYTQAGKTRNYSCFILQLSIFAFDVLFIGAASLIKVHDDLYPRVMMPVYVAIFVSIALYFYQDYLGPHEKLPKIFRVIGAVLVIVSLVMTVDMSYGFISYFKTIRPVIPEYSSIETEPYYVDSYDMAPSPLFKFTQLSPFH